MRRCSDCGFRSTDSRRAAKPSEDLRRASGSPPGRLGGRGGRSARHTFQDVFDLARYGVQFVASPRHADGIVITGVVSVNMREALERTYAAVPDPRLVIAVGACAIGGGPFAGSPEALGVPEDIPVDLWVPGCPPHPYTLMDGLLRLLGRIGTERR